MNHFSGLPEGLAAHIDAAIAQLGLAGPTAEEALVTLVSAAYALGREAGRQAPACGCAKCSECGNWVQGCYCDLCGLTIG